MTLLSTRNAGTGAPFIFRRLPFVVLFLPAERHNRWLVPTRPTPVRGLPHQPPSEAGIVTIFSFLLFHLRCSHQ